MSLTAQTTPPDALTALDRVGQLLHRRAEIAQSLAAAVADDNRGAAQHHARALESLAAELREANRPLAAELPRMGAEAQRLLKALMAASRAADQQVAAALAAKKASSLAEWLERAPSPEALAAELLAEPWDKERDLVFLAGAGAVAAAAGLRAAGQKRVFAFDPAAPEALPGNKPDVVNAHRLEDLQAACWSLAYPFPALMRARAVGGGLPVPVAELAAPISRMVKTFAQASNDGERLAHVFVRSAVRGLEPVSRSPSVAVLADAFRGRPAVVVAAGPSLDKNIHLLARLQGRAVIIAINQTVRALRRAGVKPDIVMALDPQGLGYHFDGVEPGEIGALVLGASVDPGLHDVPTESIFTCASSPLCESWIFDLVDEKAALKCAGTVASGALQLAAYLGCSPIITIGRDLALQGHKYYADGAADGGQSLTDAEGGKLSYASLTSKMRMARNDEEARALEKRMTTELLELVEVPGYFGQPVTTTTRFTHELELLRAMLLGLRGRTEFINATEGGAYLEGMTHLTLEQAIAGLPDVSVDARAVLRQRAASIDVVERRGRFGEALGVLVDRLRQVAAAAGRCRAVCHKPRHDKSYRRAVRALSAVEDVRVLSVFLQRAIQQVLRRDVDGFTSVKQVTETEEALYRAMESAATELADSMAAVLPSIQMRGG